MIPGDPFVKLVTLFIICFILAVVAYMAINKLLTDTKDDWMKEVGNTPDNDSQEKKRLVKITFARDCIDQPCYEMEDIVATWIDASHEDAVKKKIACKDCRMFSVCRLVLLDFCNTAHLTARDMSNFYGTKPAIKRSGH